MASIVDDPCYHGKNCGCFTLQPWQYLSTPSRCEHCYCKFCGGELRDLGNRDLYPEGQLECRDCGKTQATGEKA